jgi:hypothetical protein
MHMRRHDLTERLKVEVARVTEAGNSATAAVLLDTIERDFDTVTIHRVLASVR